MLSDEENEDLTVEGEEIESEQKLIINAKIFLELRKKNVNIKKLENLLQKLENINVTDANDMNNSLLHVAIKRHQVEAVDLLLKYKANVNIRNDKDVTPIMLAKSINNNSDSNREVLDILNKVINVQKSNHEVEKDKCDARENENLSRIQNSVVLKEKNVLHVFDESRHPSEITDIVNSHKDYYLNLNAKFLKNESFITALNAKVNIFCINIIERQQQLLTSNDIIALGNKIKRSIIIQYILPSSSTVYIKESSTSDIIKVELNEQGKCTNEEFEIKLNSKKDFGMALLIEGLKTGLVGVFDDKEGLRSILNVKLNTEKYFGTLNLLDYALIHDHLLSVKYLSLFPWNLNELKNEGKSSIGIAVEKSSIDTILALYRLPVDDSFEVNVPRRVFESLNETCDSNGNTPLILSAENGYAKKLSLFIRLGMKVNESNKDGMCAVDYSWSRKDYSSVLELLNADSYIPGECKIEENDKDIPGAKELKQYLCDRNELHKEIEKGNLEKVEELIKKQSSQVCLSQQNESALFAAGNNKKWNVYAFLSWTGTKFKSQWEEQEFENSLLREEKEAIKRELEQYIFEVENSHLIRLVTKSKIYGEIANPKKIIEKFYSELDKISYISSIMQVLQYSRNLEIIFDLIAVSTKHMDLEDSCDTKGKTDYINGVIKIAAKESIMEGRTKSEVLGTLSHELTHFAMSLLYSNECNPYRKDESTKVMKFEEISYNILKLVCKTIAVEEVNNLIGVLTEIDNHFIRTVHSVTKDRLFREIKGIPEEVLREIVAQVDEKFVNDVKSKNVGDINDIIKRVYTQYERKYWNLELIVRIPHILAVYGEEKGKDIIKKEVPKLLEYYEEYIMRDCRDFLKNGPHMKHAITILDMNDYLGEIKSIEQGKIRLVDSSANIPNWETYSDSFHLVRTSSIHLCSLYFYQKFSKEYRSQFQQCCLFLKLSFFEKNKNKVLNALKSKACKAMVLISDSALPCDLENLSVTFKSISDEIYLIVNENHPSVLQVARYTWNSLTPSSKDYLMGKTFYFHGRRTCLKNIFDSRIETDYELLDESALATLVEDYNIVVGDEKEMSCKGYDVDCYIDRYFRLQTICSDILKEEENLLLFISNATEQDLNTLGAPEKLLQQWKNGENYFEKGKKIIFHLDRSGKQDGKVYDQIYQKITKQKKVHWLHLLKDCLVWKNSNGDLSDLTKLINKDVTIEYKSELEFFDADHGDNIIVLAANPGMGKSTVLTKLAEVKKGDFWVVRFNLVDYVTNFKKIDFCENQVDKAIEYVASLLDFKNPFEACLFKQCCKLSKNVLLIFDGFDEIYPGYKENVISLLKALKSSSVAQIWITTRLHEKFSLEKELKVLAFTLNYWTIEDQLKFLNAFWKKKLKFVVEGNIDKVLREIDSKLRGFQTGIKEWELSIDEENNKLLNSVFFSFNEEPQQKVSRLKAVVDKLNFSPYADKLLEQLNKTMCDKEGKFSVVPLHSLMLGNVVFEYSFKIPKDFNLNDLYDFFVYGKFNIFYEKKKLENENFEAIRNSHRDLIEKAHQVEAMKLFFNGDMSFPKEFFQQHSKDVHVSLIQIGLVTPSQDGFKFIHRTFAEYFLSEGLIENSGNAYIQRFWLEKILIDDNFAVVRSFLNSMIAKKKPFIYFDSQLLEEKNFFRQNKKIGTCFHRLSFEGHESLLGIFFEIFPEKVCEIISIVNVAFENILHCACHSNCKKVISKILAFANKNLRRESIEKLILQRDRSGRTPFFVAVENNSCEAMNLFFLGEYFNFSDKIRKEMFFKTKKRGQTVLHEAVIRGYEHATEQLFKLAKSILSNDKCKKFLIKCDSGGENVFHYASCKANINILQYLWNISRSLMDENSCKDFLTRPDTIGETVLHKAAFRGHDNVMKEILEYASQVCSNGSFEVFMTMSDNMKETVLHKAALRGHVVVLNSFLKRCKVELSMNDMKNFLLMCNMSGRTVLHQAALISNVETFKLLWEFCNDLDNVGFLKDILFRTDDNGDTILHLAASEGHAEFVNEILSMIKVVLSEETLREYLMLTNKKCHTAFHCAVFVGEIKTFSILYSFAKCVLSKSCIQQFMFITNHSCGSSLHFAALKGNANVLNNLWNMFKCETTDDFFKEFVNVINENGDTILHVATFKGCNWFTKEILKMTVNVLSKESLGLFLQRINNFQETFLHRASLKGNSNIFAELCDISIDIVDEGTISAILFQSDGGGDTVAHKIALRGYTLLMNNLLIYAQNILSKESFKKFLLKTNNFGYTILHVAVLKDNIEFLDIMKTFHESNYLEEDFFVEFLTRTDMKWGDTVLHKVAFRSCYNVLDKLLVFAKCVLSNCHLNDFLMSLNNKEYTFLHKSVSFSKFDFFNEMCDKISILLDDEKLKFFLTIPNKYRNTVLHTVADRGDIAITKKLCEMLNDIVPVEFFLRTDSDLDTVLHKATIKGNVDVLFYLADLIEKKTCKEDYRKFLFHRNKHGNTFIQLASRIAEKDTVEKHFIYIIPL